jgi:hypothetical protein
LNQTPPTRYTRDPPTCLWWIIRSVNSTWTSRFLSWQQKSENYNSVQRRSRVKIVFLWNTIQRISLFIITSDNTLIFTKISVKQCTDIGARTHVCGFSFNVFNIRLNFRGWFALCLVYSYFVLVLLSEDED